MTLSLVFRIQAVMMAFFGVMMLAVPAAMMSSFNVGDNAMACLLYTSDAADE